MPYIKSLDWQAYLTALTEHGRRITLDGGQTAVLEFIDAGQLRLRSGRVSVRDPSWGYNAGSGSDMVFVTVRPGAYPVHVISAVFDFRGSRVSRGAAVCMQVTGNPPVSWLPALGTSLDDAASFGVDAGAGTILDVDQLPMLNEPHIGRWLEETVWAGEVAAGYPSNGDRDVIAFGCGMGDGSYPVLLGYDTAGDLASILIDCELCSWSPEWAEISAEPPPSL